MDKFYRIGKKLELEDYVAETLLYCIRIFGDNPDDIPVKVFTNVLLKKCYYRKDDSRNTNLYDPTDFELGRIVDKVGDIYKDKSKTDYYVVVRLLCKKAKIKTEYVELFLKYHSYKNPKDFYKENNVKAHRVKYAKNLIKKALKDKYNDYLELVKHID